MDKPQSENAKTAFFGRAPFLVHQASSAIPTSVSLTEDSDYTTSSTLSLWASKACRANSEDNRLNEIKSALTPLILA